MSLPHRDDSPELCALKLELYNLRKYLDRDLSEEHFQQASDRLKHIWARWSELNNETGDEPS